MAPASQKSSHQQRPGTMVDPGAEEAFSLSLKRACERYGYLRGASWADGAQGHEGTPSKLQSPAESEDESPQEEIAGPNQSPQSQTLSLDAEASSHTRTAPIAIAHPRRQNDARFESDFTQSPRVGPQSSLMERLPSSPGYPGFFGPGSHMGASSNLPSSLQSNCFSDVGSIFLPMETPGSPLSRRDSRDGRPYMMGYLLGCPSAQAHSRAPSQDRGMRSARDRSYHGSPYEGAAYLGASFAHSQALSRTESPAFGGQRLMNRLMPHDLDDSLAGAYGEVQGGEEIRVGSDDERPMAALHA